ncbi:hypothetical protein C4D60_Mb03t22270 [Musa balbisiana]|uniref:UNC-50 family protein n=1 Tax=Musa balbisiana TaxID=52838 RepID=A0A4S8JBU4_MUSBA|nr:hypothetical protein C4D60_Mb03t22270 [Musa balbisiana]
MLPTVSKTRGTSAVRPAPGFSQYLRRIVKWQQMDIEYTFWQMLHLCTSPKVVYGVTWVHSVFTVISVVVFHFLLAGTILATCCWFLTNTYMREETPSSHAVEQRVEWLYAFDVHCNSFFPAFVLLYVIQYFVSPLLVAHGFFPMLVSNLLFMVAISYYHYLNFLGYDVLPFLDKTTFFLYPIGLWLQPHKVYDEPVLRLATVRQGHTAPQGGQDNPTAGGWVRVKPLWVPDTQQSQETERERERVIRREKGIAVDLYIILRHCGLRPSDMWSRFVFNQAAMPAGKCFDEADRATHPCCDLGRRIMTTESIIQSSASTFGALSPLLTFHGFLVAGASYTTKSTKILTAGFRH